MHGGLHGRGRLAGEEVLAVAWWLGASRMAPTTSSAISSMTATAPTARVATRQGDDEGK